MLNDFTESSPGLWEKAVGSVTARVKAEGEHEYKISAHAVHPKSPDMTARVKPQIKTALATAFVEAEKIAISLDKWVTRAGEAFQRDRSKAFEIEATAATNDAIDLYAVLSAFRQNPISFESEAKDVLARLSKYANGGKGC